MGQAVRGGDARPSGGEAALRVFLSYSRADMAFADELARGLEALGGFDVMIDREDIHEGEAWRRRLGGLIAAADTVVFVVSPRSATSPICLWEVEEAERLSKRILPVQAAALDGATPPRQLAELNYVRFDPEAGGAPRSFVQGLVALRRALNTDIDWLREHTRLLTRAQEWEAAGRPGSRLLAGSDVEAAKAWLASPPREAPPPTELHHAFIQASDLAEVARNSSERQRAEQLARANRLLRWAFAGIALLAASTGVAAVYAYRTAAETKQLAIRLAAAQARQAAGASAPPAATRRLPEVKSPTTGGAFLKLGRIEVTADSRSARVIEEISFRDAKGQLWTVPAGTIADGASIPFGLWSFVRSPFEAGVRSPDDEAILRASVLHGYYSATRSRGWEETHTMFYEALRAGGVGETMASTLYAGLLYGGPRWTNPK